MAVGRAEIARVVRAGLVEHLDAVMTPRGFRRASNSTIYRRTLGDGTQKLDMFVSRRAGSPLWLVRGRFEVDFPQVMARAVSWAPTSALATTGSMFWVGIDEVWGIASGSWYVAPEGVPEFMAKVGRHVDARIAPLFDYFSSVDSVASREVPESLPRGSVDPLMIACCQAQVGGVTAARRTLVAVRDLGDHRLEWAEQSLAALSA